MRSSTALGGFIVPEAAVDAQSLIAYADLVVSAGGTMNREAVALGTPVFTVFEGRLGAVDERLIADGRLQRARAPGRGAIVDKRRPASAGRKRIRRDPAFMAELLSPPAAGGQFLTAPGASRARLTQRKREPVPRST